MALLHRPLNHQSLFPLLLSFLFFHCCSACGTRMNKKERLQKQVAESRQAMFDEGILNDYFLQLELIEESQPNFVEKIIGTYLTQSTLYLDELQETLETKPLDIATVERLIQKLRGGSASIGAGKFRKIIDEYLWKVFQTKKTDGLYAAYEKVRGEHAALRLRLEAYAELLGLLRDAVAPDQGSENLDQEDLESVDSNDMNE